LSLSLSLSRSLSLSLCVFNSQTHLCNSYPLVGCFLVYRPVRINLFFTVFYDWIKTKIQSITQLSKPSLKEQNNGSDLHHYKHMSTSHFSQNNTHKRFAKHYTRSEEHTS